MSPDSLSAHLSATAPFYHQGGEAEEGADCVSTQVTSVSTVRDQAQRQGNVSQLKKLMGAKVNEGNISPALTAISD